MVDEYEAALQNSTCRKEHDEERKFQAGQCFDKLEQGAKYWSEIWHQEVVLESLDHIGNQKLQKLSHDTKMM